MKVVDGLPHIFIHSHERDQITSLLTHARYPTSLLRRRISESTPETNTNARTFKSSSPISALSAEKRKSQDLGVGWIMAR